MSRMSPPAAPSVVVRCRGGPDPSLITVTIPPAAATPPGQTGRIVWVRYDPTMDSAALVAGRLNGGRQRQLTHPEPGIRDSEPVRSPDGTQVIFNRDSPTARSGSASCRCTAERHVSSNWLPGPVLLRPGPQLDPGRQSPHLYPRDRTIDPVTGDAASALQYTERLDGTDLTLLSVPGAYEDNTVRFSPMAANGLHPRPDCRRRAALRDLPDESRPDPRPPTDPWGRTPSARLSPARSGPTAGPVSFETHGGGHPPRETLHRCHRRARPSPRASTRRARHPHTGTAKQATPHRGHPPAIALRFAQEDGTGNVDIYTIRPDGRHQRQVTHLPVPKYSPAWELLTKDAGRMP